MAFRLFVPILAGATLRDRLIACLGALVAIAITGAVCGFALGDGYDVPLIVAPMGASAVLLFAVPASPLAQPWSIVGGNTISAGVGLLLAYVVDDPILASGLAVACAIAAMSLTRCLHPPGGAAALTAALGGPAVIGAGWLFPFVPVAINSLLMVAVGLCFHKIAGRNYPHRPAPPVNTHGTSDPPPQMRVGFQMGDVDAALTALDETFDIDRADLERLLRQVEFQALLRSSRSLLCEDIMSRDIIMISPETTADDARQLLLDHNLRTLPIVDDEKKLLGTVGLRELSGVEGNAASFLSAAATAHPQSQAMALLPVLADGRTHAVVIVDGEAVVGIITQTDLLAATAGLDVRPRKGKAGSSPSYDI
jgi:CBS domain-containing membrane protein